LEGEIMTADHQDDEIGRLLRGAYDAPPRAEFVESLRTRSENALRGARQAEKTPATPAVTGTKPLRNSALALLAVAAIALVCVLPWLAGTRHSWAGVVEAVRTKPWIHATATGPDGQTFEGWFSPTHQVSATRRDGIVRFYDHRLDLVYSYDAKSKQLVRSADSSGRTKEAFQRFQGAFEAIFRGHQKLDSPFLAAEVVEQKRRRVPSDDKTWVEYELLLERAAKQARVVFRVDPETLLPESMKLLALDEGMVEMTFHLDYPKEGPADVYALGVPRDAQLVDRVPKADLARLIQGVEASRQRFPDSYYAIVIGTPMPGDNPLRGFHSFTHFWRNADKWRLEQCFPGGPKAREAILRFREAVPPTPGEDLTAWRKKWLKDFEFGPVVACDGETIYRNTGSFGEPKWEVFQKVDAKTAGHYFPFASHSVPEQEAYPGLLPPSEQFAVELREEPHDGPPGTVLYQVRPMVENAGGHPWKLYRYWIDPARSYVNLRYELLAPDGEPSICVKEGLQQASNGIWYPTIIRRKNRGMEREGGEGRVDEVWYFYVDFGVKLPDALFKPADRPADD